MSDTAGLTLDYLEFTSPKLEETQTFFANVFGWSFVEYGPDYRDLQGAGLGGGVERAEVRPPLPVVRVDDLEAMFDRVKATGVEITQEIFSFPGGRRFQFREPGGTEMGVWAISDE